MSSATSVSEALTGYLAGNVTAEKAIATVAAAYYTEDGARSRERLRPLIEIIERAHPGVVELGASADNPGFGVRLAERPLPTRYAVEFRQAVESLLVAPSSVPRGPGLFTRMVLAIRRVFSA